MVLQFLTPLQKSILDECLKAYQLGIQAGISITGVPGQYDYKTAKSLEVRGLLSLKEGQEANWDTLAYFTDQQAIDYQKTKDEVPKGKPMDEVIKWIPVDEQLPDDEMTVLINHPALNEPVWLGYHCNGFWYEVDGGLLPGMAVKYWAEMPEGMGGSHAQ